MMSWLSQTNPSTKSSAETQSAAWHLWFKCHHSITELLWVRDNIYNQMCSFSLSGCWSLSNYTGGKFVYWILWISGHIESWMAMSVQQLPRKTKAVPFPSHCGKIEPLWSHVHFSTSCYVHFLLTPHSLEKIPFSNRSHASVCLFERPMTHLAQCVVLHSSHAYSCSLQQRHQPHHVRCQSRPIIRTKTSLTDATKLPLWLA